MPAIVTRVRNRFRIYFESFFARAFGGLLLLLEPGADERVVQTVIALVAGVLEQRTMVFPSRPPRTRARPHRRVVDREVVLDRVVGDAP